MVKKAAAAKPKIKRETIDVGMTDIVPSKQYGARPSTAKACPYCKHPYLKPCNEKTKNDCPNYKFLQSSPNPASLIPTRSKK